MTRRNRRSSMCPHLEAQQSSSVGRNGPVLHPLVEQNPTNQTLPIFGRLPRDWLLRAQRSEVREGQTLGHQRGGPTIERGGASPGHRLWSHHCTSMSPKSQRSEVKQGRSSWISQAEELAELMEVETQVRLVTQQQEEVSVGG